MSTEQKRFRAFISYSQTDKTWARQIHTALESFRVPKGVDVLGIDPRTRKIGRFFRDDEELGATSDLGEALRGAIADSENLIVICSPKAAQSKWVSEEVLHFKRTGRAENIFAVIVKGMPNTDDPDKDCFPTALRFKLNDAGHVSDEPTEPLGLDLRKESRARVVTKLASGMLNIPFDDLWRRAQRRNAIRFAATASLIFSSLAVVGLSFWRQDDIGHFAVFGLPSIAPDRVAEAAPGTAFKDCWFRANACPDMVIVPAGNFLMGSSEGENLSNFEESPPRRVEIDAAFAVSKFEIKVDEWLTCVDYDHCDGRGLTPEDIAGGDRPVTNVSWEDSKTYVAWLSQMTGKEYRLLTEAEWEYAARAGTTTPYYWGVADPVCERGAKNAAMFLGCDEKRTQPVGFSSPNGFGLYDMHGNADEWVEDCYLDSYIDAPEDGTARVESNCSRRVIRGGSWGHHPQYLRSARRGRSNSTLLNLNTGFRVARKL